MVNDCYQRHLDPTPAPESLLDAAMTTCSEDQVIWLAVAFDLDCYWLPEAPIEPLLALYRIAGLVLQASVCRRTPEALAVVAAEGDWYAQLDLDPVDLGAALRLIPVAIPKPWGQEIWYTGIEKRGVAAVLAGRAELPLPWLLAVAPRRLSGDRQRDLILLKILDPLPDPVFGDLYFELHQEKREVYVVTHVDREAWPDGIGAIRFGFDQSRVASHASREAFLDAYLAAVAAYRSVRELIDLRLEERRAEAGVGPNDPVSAATLRSWLKEVPEELVAREERLRLAMEAFTALRPLRVGDVVKVPLRVPHSLQHGVRTVEFQTPVYERMILSFAQKVLTQATWDTPAAAAVLELGPPEPEPLEMTAQGDGWVEERIVQFEDFAVYRLSLDAGASYPVVPADHYRLLMAVGGELSLAGSVVEGDQAVLLPLAFRQAELVNAGVEPRVALLATPQPSR